jgi:hypothetical protein
MAFPFIGTVFSVRRIGNSVFVWKGGITFFNGIMGTDRHCDKGPWHDDTGRGGGGTQSQGQNKGGWYNPASCPTTQLLKI